MPKPKIDPHVVKICKEYGIPSKSDKDDPEAPFWFHNQSGQHLMKASWINILAAKAKVTLNHMTLEHVSDDRGKAGGKDVPLFVVVKVDGWIVTDEEKGDVFKWVAFGECNTPGNNHNTYPVAMAEKRAKSRLILMLTGLHGFIYSEDEMGGTMPGETSAPEPEAVMDDSKAWALKIETAVTSVETVEELKALWDGEEENRTKYNATPEGRPAVEMAKDAVNRRLKQLRPPEVVDQ